MHNWPISAIFPSTHANEVANIKAEFTFAKNAFKRFIHVKISGKSMKQNKNTARKQNPLHETNTEAVWMLSFFFSATERDQDL